MKEELISFLDDDSVELQRLRDLQRDGRARRSHVQLVLKRVDLLLSRSAAPRHHPFGSDFDFASVPPRRNLAIMNRARLLTRNVGFCAAAVTLATLFGVTSLAAPVSRPCWCCRGGKVFKSSAEHCQRT